MEMEQNPLVSIVMAVCNGERYLPEQIASILQQAYLNWELLILDDASSDATQKIIRNFERQDARIHCYFNEKNLGVNKSFEKLISLASGSYIALADQDDIWLPTKIQKQVEVLQNSEAVILCFHDAELMDAEGNQIAESFWQRNGMKIFSGNIFRTEKISQSIVEKNFVSGCMTLFKKELIKYALPFPETVQFHDWWLGFVAAIWGEIKPVTQSLIRYRQHENNVLGGVFSAESLQKIPLITRYKNNFLQYQIMYQYCRNLSRKNEYIMKVKPLQNIVRQLYKYQITYYKRFKMLASPSRLERLKILLETPTGCHSPKKVIRDLEIALKTRKKFYTG
jgi:glycosyltransferase involved in cell wall biosynthesis